MKPIIVTQPLGRCPTFAELQALAGQHNVRISGNESAGEFFHPNPEQPKVTGHYAIEPSGDIHRDFTGHVMGRLAGSFTLTTRKAEIVITEKPFLLPEGVLNLKLAEVLKDFCARFQ